MNWQIMNNIGYYIKGNTPLCKQCHAPISLSLKSRNTENAKEGDSFSYLCPNCGNVIITLSIQDMNKNDILFT